jgi:hypothetical protein
MARIVWEHGIEEFLGVFGCCGVERVEKVHCRFLSLDDGGDLRDGVGASWSHDFG